MCLEDEDDGDDPLDTDVDASSFMQSVVDFATDPSTPIISESKAWPDGASTVEEASSTFVAALCRHSCLDFLDNTLFFWFGRSLRYFVGRGRYGDSDEPLRPLVNGLVLELSINVWDRSWRPAPSRDIFYVVRLLLFGSG